MVCFEQNLFFQLCRLYLIVLDNDIFAQGLHGENISCVFFLHEEHFSKSTPADHFLDLEVGELDLHVSLFGECWSVV